MTKRLGGGGSSDPPEIMFVWLHSEPLSVSKLAGRGQRARGAEAYPRNGIGIHMVCFPRQYLMRKPALDQCDRSTGTRGAKEPRSVCLGGRAEVSHLLLGGRAQEDGL